MHDTFLLPNTLLYLVIGFLSLALFYYIIKAAVRHGVQQTFSELNETVMEIERSVHEIKMAKE